MVLRDHGLTEKSQVKPILGFSDTCTVKLDFDNTPFSIVKYWGIRTMKWFRLGGFIILKSSMNSYHMVFNRSVSWSQNMKILAWVTLQSHNQGLVKYLQMQCIKKSSTLRLSSKGDKASPRIIFSYGKVDEKIADFIEFRHLIKQIIKKT